MLFIVVFMILIISCFFVVKLQNAYNGIFLAEVISVGTIIVASLISYNIFWTYETTGYFEFFIRNIITKYSLPLYGIKDLVNFGVIMHMLSSAMLCIACNSIFKQKYGFALYGFAFILLCVCSLKYNSTFFAEKIYIYLSDGQTVLKANFMQDFVLVLDVLNVALFPFLALVNLAVCFAKTDVIFKKRRLAAMFVAETVKLASVIVFLYYTPLKFFWGNVDLYDFGVFHGGVSYNSYIGIIVAILFLIFISHIFVISSGVVELRKALKKYTVSKSRTLCIDEIYHVFHTYKNAMFSVIAMSDMALAKDDVQDIKQIVMRIRKCAENYKNHTTAFLNTSGRSNSGSGFFDIADCISRAESMLALPSNVKIEKSIECENASVWGDENEITAAFLNLFTNAVDAIGTKKSGCIAVRVWREKNAVCINVRDNGSGIKRKDLRKTLIPLYTTKKTNKNWGLGLSQVQKAIDMHNGHIDVKSKMNCYTLFQLYIPIDVVDTEEDYDD